VLCTREHQRGVDLVADHAGTVPEHDVADPLQLRAREHPAPRVVRLGQQQRAGASREHGVESVEVDVGRLGLRIGPQLDQGPAGQPRHPELRRVARCREDHRRDLRQHRQCQPHPGGHVDGRDHPVGIDLGPEVAPHEAGVRRSETLVGPEHRVAGDGVVERPSYGVVDHGVEVVVHLGHPGRDDVVGHAAPLVDQGAPSLLVGEVDDRAAIGHGRLTPRISWTRTTSPAMVSTRASTPSKRTMPRIRSTNDTSISTS
jgi:hypothetical protein